MRQQVDKIICSFISGIMSLFFIIKTVVEWFQCGLYECNNYAPIIYIQCVKFTTKNIFYPLRILSFFFNLYFSWSPIRRFFYVHMLRFYVYMLNIRHKPLLPHLDRTKHKPEKIEGMQKSTVQKSRCLQKVKIKSSLFDQK